MRDVTMQDLHNCGLNPFAAQLLVESWKGHPTPKPVAFRLGGVECSMGYDPHMLLACLRMACHHLETGIPITPDSLDNIRTAIARNAGEGPLA